MTFDDKPIRILLVDDSPSLLWGMGKLVQGEFPRMMLIGTARTDGEALVHAYFRPDVIVLDLDLGGYSGIDIIPALKERSGGSVLVHTGVSDPRLHADAILFGAADLVGKGSSAEILLDAIEGVHAGECRNFDASVIEPPSADRLAAAAAGAAMLSAADRRLVADLVAFFRSPPSTACRATPLLARITSLYDALGLRNRLELSRFASPRWMAQLETVGEGTEGCQSQ